ncbi:MAG: ParB/RepB/Spo0J family partition protein [Myxococcales bacterium]|nr:ParB/RepB/Spo0J family partition protein [Myxococcales bacterium]
MVQLPLSDVDLDDETFRFRAALRVGPLRDSIAAEGQQLPIIVRPSPLADRPHPYQIVSGFRRTTALRQLGAPTVAAIVRSDLQDDEAAFRTSVLENSQRRTYSDIDRALVIKSYADRGFTSVDVARLMGLSKRQTNNLRSLLELPKTVQQAIDDPDLRFTATHGLVLKQLKGRHPSLHYGTWVRAVHDGNDGSGLSVSQLKRAVNARYPADDDTATLRIFRPDETRPERGVFRLQPAKIDVATLTEEQRAALRDQLGELLNALDAIPRNRT